MPQVHLLPPDVIAKIAAGEVIERPSSVVKELVENSIDAGADHIEIHLKDAGKELIHIKDNGCGIARDDLETIFLRHATSKISSADDLYRLCSLGFRGEALYSVAAIADVTLRSATKDDKVDGAWEIRLRGGERKSLEPAASAGHGTEIKIAELFYNTPARKKFLKSGISEMGAVLGVVIPYTLLYPHIRFFVTNSGKRVLDCPPTETKAARMAKVLNVKEADLITIQQDYQEHGVAIEAVLGNINIQRKRRDLQYLFVNNRPVENKNIGFNINDVYRLIFPPGVYPTVAINIHVHPEEVDANMHPTKKEVKLRQESQVNSLLRYLIEHALMTKGDVRKVSQLSAVSSQQPNGLSEPLQAGGFRVAQDYSSTPQVRRMDTPEELFTPTSVSELPADYNMPEASGTLSTKFRDAAYIGQSMRKYLLWESRGSLLLVDQHAAQERIMFERFRDQMERKAIEVQKLLAPVLLALDPHEKNNWESAQDRLSDAGFETTQFDEDTIAVQTHPVLIRNTEAAVRTLLSGEKLSRCDADTLARRACKASIVTGDKLAPAQAEHQRNELLACQHPFTCPHGRPTVIEITDGFLEKQFLRT